MFTHNIRLCIARHLNPGDFLCSETVLVMMMQITDIVKYMPKYLFPLPQICLPITN